MFARFLELTIKPEHKLELIRVIKEEAFPVLKKYNGFFDMITLEVETEPAKLFAISLWHEKLDAEKYEKENFSTVKAMYEPFLTKPIVVKLCKVDETVPRKIAKVAVAA